MDECMNGLMDGWMDKWMNGLMDGWMDGPPIMTSTVVPPKNPVAVPA